jgi:hypothetical protein
MEAVTSLEVQVLKVNGELMLLIPLECGGRQLVECAQGISEVQGEFLKIAIPEWLAGVLRIEGGDLVKVNNRNGEFNIFAVSPRLLN